ncbi:hypothetical protein SNEBB_008141 [Seison nebaliae]|nr:hypothetical protein SNEBB_008141 [Seison nebaliae]
MKSKLDFLQIVDINNSFLIIDESWREMFDDYGTVSNVVLDNERSIYSIYYFNYSSSTFQYEEQLLSNRKFTMFIDLHRIYNHLQSFPYQMEFEFFVRKFFNQIFMNLSEIAHRIQIILSPRHLDEVNDEKIHHDDRCLFLSMFESNANRVEIRTELIPFLRFVKIGKQMKLYNLNKSLRRWMDMDDLEEMDLSNKQLISFVHHWLLSEYSLTSRSTTFTKGRNGEMTQTFFIPLNCSLTKCLMDHNNSYFNQLNKNHSTTIILIVDGIDNFLSCFSKTPTIFQLLQMTNDENDITQIGSIPSAKRSFLRWKLNDIDEKEGNVMYSNLFIHNINDYQKIWNEINLNNEEHINDLNTYFTNLKIKYDTSIHPQYLKYEKVRSNPNTFTNNNLQYNAFVKRYLSSKGATFPFNLTLQTFLRISRLFIIRNDQQFLELIIEKFALSIFHNVEWMKHLKSSVNYPLDQSYDVQRLLKKLTNYLQICHNNFSRNQSLFEEFNPLKNGQSFINWILENLSDTRHQKKRLEKIMTQYSEVHRNISSKQSKNSSMTNTVTKTFSSINNWFKNVEMNENENLNNSMNIDHTSSHFDVVVVIRNATNISIDSNKDDNGEYSTSIPILSLNGLTNYKKLLGDFF